jgi:glycosyltransferase involved in cell wall biosynthesis
MRFALYHPWTYLRSGIERIFVELFRRSNHSWTLYTHHFDAQGTYQELSDVNVVELAPRVSVERALGPLARAAWTIGRTRLPADGSRGLLVSSEGLGDLILARNELPAVCFCHTPLKILHDPATREGLRQRDARKHLALSMLGPGFNAVDRRMWRRYRHVFVSSEEVRTRARRAGLEPSGAFEILPPGVDLEWFSDDGGAREDFFLVAGRVKWWKNIELAVAGLAEAHRRGVHVPMVIAGGVDQLDMPYVEGLRAQARGLPVSFETQPSQERLRELYRRCRALVFPSLNEDFGMVPLEAMACGAPVIAVDAGGPRETVVRGETGWLVAPTAEAFADAMGAAMRNERPDQIRRAARARASAYTWDRFVDRVDAVMEQVASQESKGRQGIG